MFSIFDYVLPAFKLYIMSAHDYAQLMLSTIIHFNDINNDRKFSVVHIYALTRDFTLIMQSLEHISSSQHEKGHISAHR